MRSSSFGAIVSPRGASVAPRTFTSLSSSTRSSRGGLASLATHPVQIESPKTKAAPETSMQALRGTLHVPQPRQMLSAMNPKLPKAQAAVPSMPHLKEGGKLASARRKLAQGGAVKTPRSKKTVDMVEDGRVVVRHQFYGKNPKEAAHMLRSHKKADKSFADALEGKKYKGIDIKAVRRARGGSIPGYDDGGSIPSYDEYLASPAAPKGLDPEQYQQDYVAYAHDLQGANQPYLGRYTQYTGNVSPDLNDPMTGSEVAQGNPLPLMKPALEGNLNAKGKNYLAAAKDAYGKRFATTGSLALGALTGAAPFMVPARLSTLLFANDLGKMAGVMPEGVPSWSTFYDLIDKTGAPDVHPLAYSGAQLGTGVGGAVRELPEMIETARTKVLRPAARKLLGYKQAQPAE